jgi:hypothetical protein
MVPKDKGCGLVPSSCQCRDVGYDPDISTDQYKAVNAERLGAFRHLPPSSRNGKKYVDEEAAIAVHGKAEKSKLDEEKSAWSVDFEFGSNYDGYWTYEHLVTQIEDLADVSIQVQYPWIQFLILVDHSSGHGKKRPDGLNAGTETVQMVLSL